MSPFVAQELRRLLGKIPETDPTTTDYHILLQSIECFAGIAEAIEQIIDEAGDPASDPADGKIIRVEFIPQGKPMVEDDPPAPAPAEEAKPEQEEQPAKEYDIVEVRKAMREAKKKGVDIAELIHSFGATNLSDLPKEKYGELMQKLED